ncbi:MAG: alpha/beta hydrolase, partial [Clostridia bacterium]|nr:alpha/beta hydrolase [Clostridia bacterium]
MTDFRPILHPSSDGLHTLHGLICIPQEPRGVVHIVHGVAEHIDRYRSMMQELAQAGYITVGFDLPGHGQTAQNDDELGFFSAEQMVHATVAAAESLHRQYDGLPYYLFGHSMGSFIARCAAETFTPDKLILIGTSGPNPVAVPGLAVVGLIRLLRGDRHRSGTAHQLMFGGYNARFPQDDPHHWLSSDPEVRTAYAQDPRCGFVLTAAGSYGLIRLCQMANRDAWFRSIRQRCPVLLLSGALDPVGDYGKGVLTVYHRLRKYGTD